MGAWILIGIIVLVALMATRGYQSLVTLRNRVRNAWSPIEVQLIRRHDRIQDLVDTAESDLTHERELLEDVIRTRQQAIDARGIHEQAEAENLLSQTLRRFFAAAEAGPEVAANQKMLVLQEELVTTENEIAVARRFYNDQVIALNRKIHQFPWSLIARAGGFRPAEYFIIDEPTPHGAPKVAC
jgi:LemA protein